MSVIPYLLAVWIFLTGLYGIVTSRNLVHLVICLSVCQSATYVFLLGIGYRSGGKAPVLLVTMVRLPSSTSWPSASRANACRRNVPLPWCGNMFVNSR